MNKIETTIRHRDQSWSARGRLGMAMAGAIALTFLTASLAQAAFADRPVTLVVGFPPGNPNDTLARLVATRLSTLIGQPVVVENKPGAGGLIAAQSFIGSEKADGYTMLLGSASLTTGQAMWKKPRFDVRRDLEPLAMIATSPMAIVTNNDTPAKNLSEFLSYAKQNPGKINYGSTGVGGVVHLQGLNFSLQEGIDTVHVPYPGGAPALIGLLRNDVQLLVIDVASIVPMADRLRPLAVAGDKRISQLPDLPTTNESGVNFHATVWYGLFASSKAPREVTQALQQQLQRVWADPSFRSTIASQGSQVSDMTPEEMRQFVSDEIGRWENLVKSAKIEQND